MSGFLTLDSIQKCVILGAKGYVSKLSLIEVIDKKRGFICPYYQNYDVVIRRIVFGDLINAYICEGWMAAIIAEKVGGTVVPEKNAVPFDSNKTLALKNDLISLFPKLKDVKKNIVSRTDSIKQNLEKVGPNGHAINRDLVQQIIGFTHFVAYQLAMLLNKGSSISFPITVSFQDLTYYVRDRGDIDTPKHNSDNLDDIENVNWDTSSTNQLLILGLYIDKRTEIIYHDRFMCSQNCCNSSIWEIVCHEVFHWFQHEFIRSNKSDVKFEKLSDEWKANFDHYIQPWDDVKGYENQIVEVDARWFSEFIYKNTKDD